MSKKHYQQVAEIISKVRSIHTDENSKEAINHIASELCIMFKMDNASFKGFKFLEACGLREK
jgi:hypothetical protein